jgi:co-chaperonin GroES (HSP10)
MGAQTTINPDTIRCMPGKILVKIVEILGGKSKGGILLPESYQDHMGKDTFYGEILQIGPAPQLEHYKSGQGPGLDVRPNKSGKPWNQETMSQFKIGDIVIFPRDVPVVFVWEEQRYALCLIHEGIVSIDKEDFRAEDFEVVPWQAPQIP